MKNKPNGQVTDKQLLEAEEGLVRLLHAKRFPREWIERHAPEAMAQARTDFAVRLAAKREDETVGLLVVIGYRRALKVLNAERRAPSTTSLETVFHLADESTATPEEEAITHDREERVAKAMTHLPERERELMALVYFNGMSIRAAGRRLGWGKSVANRHHQAALDRLNAMLDRSLLAPEIALPAFVATRHHPLSRSALIWLEGAAETVRQLPPAGLNRIGGLAETGNAAALGGTGRAVGGVCGAAVVACLAGAATGVVGPGVGALGVGDAAPLAPRAASDTHVDDAPPAGSAASMVRPVTDGTPRARSSGTGSDRQPPRRSRTGKTQPLGETQRRASSASAPAASPHQTVEEFGVEGGGGGGSSSAGSSTVENSPISPSSARPQAPASSGTGSSSSSEDAAADPEASSEFGM
ncbi:MAG TPA: sigma-70 family RNA polymerase sigma factor [Solirubrobacterales bacterium]|nr:sigma-70 family RNA polymerase sigma factor [Solirubrobacterales bacterium]